MLSSYQKKIEKKFKKLTLSEEIELAQKIKEGDKKAEDKLICSNLKFVISFCRKYEGQGIPIEDLVSAGNMGLIDAAKRYDPDQHNNEKFITFAVWYIKHYVFDTIMMNRFIYRIPNTYHNDILKLSKTRAMLGSRLNREPTNEEILEEIGMEESHFDIISDITDKNKFVSLSEYVGKSQDVTYADVICSDQEGIDKTYELRERRLEIFKALEGLTKRERDIVIAYYGLQGVNNSLKIISEDLNLTKEAIRIIKNKALDKLKSKSSALKDFI
jgi:RNA polymerase primary sigma factor